MFKLKREVMSISYCIHQSAPLTSHL